MYRSLSDFIATLEEMGQLKRITAEVSSDLEITEIADRVVKNKGPALLFENVKDKRFPVLINHFGSEERMLAALGHSSYKEIQEKMIGFLKPEQPKTLLDKVKMAPKLIEISKFFPKEVKSAPCKEVVMHDPDLSKLPILRCWPDDPAPFITLPMVFSKNPSNGIRNCGMYRMQVYNKDETGMHWQLHKDGAHHFLKSRYEGTDTMEVAVALGGDPVITYAATAPMPPDMDEMMLAGFLRGKPVDMIKCETVDIEVPADAEFVLEGTVDLTTLRREGPFGDHTGYYSLADNYPVFKITCITHRKNAIYPTTIVGIPPMEDEFLAKASERIFLPLLQMTLPEIVDYDLPVHGCFHNCAIVSIKKRYPGHARKIAHALWGLGQMMFCKCIIVVDEDVDVHNYEEVFWRVSNNIDPQRDIHFVEGPVDSLDHAAPLNDYGSKMGIDATRKWKSEGFDREWPGDIVMSADVKQRVTERWEEYGFDKH